MYLKNNDIKYQIISDNLNEDIIVFVLNSNPSEISGKIDIYSDDDMYLLSFNTENYICSTTSNDNITYTYRLSKENSSDIDTMRSSKISELSEACENTIFIGVDVGDKHYSMTLADQLNLESLKNSILSGAIAVPYHADGQGCTLYTAEEFLTVYNTCAYHKISHTTYFNQLKQYVETLTSVSDIAVIRYGQELSGEYLDNYNQIMSYLNGGVDDDGTENLEVIS